jgi:small subunit ribosomal protein S1
MNLGVIKLMEKGSDEMTKNDFPATEQETQGGNEFMEMFEESLKSVQTGKVVKGEIVQIDKEFVLVDIGYKSEGQIHLSEFVDPKGNITANVGDKVNVLVVTVEDKEGRVILSKEKAGRVRIWDVIEDAYKNHSTIRGKIISRMKGGFSVDIGIEAFLPRSQADLRPVKDLDALLGTEHDFKIVKYERRQGNVVLSRRAVLEAERKGLREETLKRLEKDAVVEGIVSNIRDYGLFIDIEGIDGLVHITDLSWGKVGHPSDRYQIGDKIMVKVLSFDKEKERLSLGVKQLTPDPWSKVQEKYAVGTKVTGRVESLKEYGAFVELEEGIRGLVHVSEIAWTGKVKHPSQILSAGETVEAVILDLDVPKKRISLSIKQTEPNPWESIAERYPKGAIIEGQVKDITKFGIFVGIEDDIDALVHISDISWTRQVNHPSEFCKKGDTVQAIILDIDQENQRFSLGIKQLTPDPWDMIPEKYKQGTRVTGKVTSVTDFGVFMELEEGIEGLIHISQLPKVKDGDPLKDYQIQDEIEAEVVNVSREERRIGLSIRKLRESAERNIQKGYVRNPQQATSNLGDLLKEKMMELPEEED